MEHMGDFKNNWVIIHSPILIQFILLAHQGFVSNYCMEIIRYQYVS